jgi:hypothetical protein
MASSAVIVGDSGAVLKNTTIQVGINDPQAFSAAEINCYPNPATDFVTLSVPAYSNTMADAGIFTMNGTLVKSFSGTGLTPGENEIRLDLADLSPGVYFVRISAGETTSEKRIVLVH